MLNDETLTLLPRLVPDGEIAPPPDPHTTRHYRYGQHLTTTVSGETDSTFPVPGTTNSFYVMRGSYSTTNTAGGEEIEHSESMSFVEEYTPTGPLPPDPTRPLYLLAPAHMRGKPAHRYSSVGGNASRTDYSYTLGNFADGQFIPNVNGTAVLTTEIDKGSAVNAGDYDSATVEQPLISHKRARIATLNGKVLREENWVFNTPGTYSLLSTTSYGYNADWKLTSTTRDGAVVYSAEYTDGLLTAETDESGVRTEYSNFNLANHAQTITKVGVAASGGLPAIENAVTTVVFDAENRVVSRSTVTPSTSTPIVETAAP